ncbi:intracellular sulfur oxidation DsrE/DsrF family protein [Salirhabdus euzebyi]|uniref:Intracellular sulfur oxidation DsrE/DsrF family protein n=1 Tax=Salirhabdus euzebyi TaxID=394506 RepID=A0A841Q9A8_9BACI|nr:hypothetical protein [Salirhabdus euzebyi]MBB6454884.1 intracellular sulfur oxidation DsrE/DsrF family protein [Salirhabdus euzebyi]
MPTSNQNNNLKKSFDRYIGVEPLVKSTDKEKFHDWLQHKKKKPTRHMIPRLATALLVVLLVGAMYLLNQTIEQPNQVENPPVVENIRVPFEKVEEKINQIMSTYTVGMTKEEVTALFGEGIPYEGQSELDGQPYEAIEYQFFGERDGDDLLHPFMDGEEPYINGEIGLNFNIIWYENDRSFAFINYLDEQNEYTRIQFGSDGQIHKDNEFLGNALYQLDATEYFVESIATALGKDAKAVTEEDLLRIEALTLKPSSSVYHANYMEQDHNYFKKMENLTSLAMTDMQLPIEVVVHFKNLTTLTYDNSGVLAKLEELNKLESLEEIILKEIYNQPLDISVLAESNSIRTIKVDDLETVVGVEKLEEAGITVEEIGAE